MKIKDNLNHSSPIKNKDLKEVNFDQVSYHENKEKKSDIKDSKISMIDYGNNSFCAYNFQK